MESAIAPHLRCPRLRERRITDDFQPPFPAWTARGDHAAHERVMGYFGVQWRVEPGGSSEAVGIPITGPAAQAFNGLRRRLAGEGGACNIESASFVDLAGFHNAVVIGYWPSVQAHDAWWRRNTGWWCQDAQGGSTVGMFREIYFPRNTHLETLFSASDRLEGIGVMLGNRSNDTIQEHGYWGGMRDRLPASQTEALVAQGARRLVDIGPGRRMVLSHEGVALIRSGQDWSDVMGEELALYHDSIEPTLRAGMAFLRDEGLAIGCYFNRYMRVSDKEGGKPCRSFGMSAWRDLAALEHWAEHHPTHKAIFGDFLQVVQALEGRLALRLYHEVAVLQSDAQILDYLGCHDQTGMMNGLA